MAISVIPNRTSKKLTYRAMWRRYLPFMHEIHFRRCIIYTLNDRKCCNYKVTLPALRQNFKCLIPTVISFSGI